MESPAAALPARPQAFQLTQRIGPFGVWLLGFLFVSFVAGSAGGFRATTWAWTALLSWWIAVIALIVKRRFALGLLELTTIAGVLAFTAGSRCPRCGRNRCRAPWMRRSGYVAYAGIVVAALLIVERGTVPHLVGGVTAGIGILALYALGTRVLPDRLGDFSSTSIDTYRLSVPITYWNGLGIFCAIGLLLALGFAIRGERLPTRALAAAALPVLTCSMYFTFSRGAWLSLLIGFAAALAVDPRRLQLAFGAAVVGVPSGLAVVSCLPHGRIDDTTVTWPRRRTTGTASCRCCWCWRRSRRQRRSGWRSSSAVWRFREASAWRGRRTDRCARDRHRGCVWLLRVAGSHRSARLGSGEHTTRTEPDESKPNQGGNNARLFELGLSGRFAFWRAALDAFRDHPVAGTGGETFWQVWAASPRQNYSTVEPHSIYLGTLASSA